METFPKKAKSVKKPSIKIKTEAAIKIQNIFRKYKRKQTEECSIRPIVINPDNIYICFNKEEEEIPLVNFFRFKKIDKVIDLDFFMKFNNYMNEHIDFETTGIRMFCRIQLVDNKLHIYAHTEIIENVVLNEYVFKYIFYILINNNIDLKRGITIQIVHPRGFSEFSGIHKDNTIHTCITYINSELTTEIAFDTDAIELKWLKCSPLFRFNTSKQITTLCFSDSYIFHTVPIYEEEGKDPSQLNKLDEYETMREETVDGKSYLVFGDFLKSTSTQPSHRFYKPLSRQKTTSPEKRDILSCMMYDYDYTPYYISRLDFNQQPPIIVDFDEIKRYRVDSIKEKIELSEESVELIRVSKKLGDFQMWGGKNKKRPNRTKKYNYHKQSSHR